MLRDLRFDCADAAQDLGRALADAGAFDAGSSLVVLAGCVVDDDAVAEDVDDGMPA